jgi:hypothetical protein
MTIREAHILVRQLLDMESASFPRLDSTQIDVYLNLAQQKIVTERFVGTSLLRPLGVEQDQKRMQDLRTVVSEPTYIDVVPSTDLNSYDGTFLLPNDFWYIVQIEAVTANGLLPVTEITHNQSGKLKLDPFGKPSRSFNIYVSYNKSGGEILGQTSKLLIRYIIQPQKVSLNDNIGFQLPLHIHQEIVTTAVRLILTVFVPERTQLTDLNKVE